MTPRDGDETMPAPERDAQIRADLESLVHGVLPTTATCLAAMFVFFAGTVHLVLPPGDAAIMRAIGIAGGILFSWTFIAIPLRRETARLGALTLPDYFELRFNDRTRLLRIVSMVVILVFYTAYVAAQLQKEASISKERRKAREERALAGGGDHDQGGGGGAGRGKKKKKGGGRGGTGAADK